MSEKEIKPRWLIALAPEVPRGVYREVEDRLREEIAAAEERGRRSGVEDANDLRELLREARAYLSLRKLKGKITEHESNLLLRLDPVALAPRDSAPGGDCQIVGCQIIGKHDHPTGGPSEARK